MVKAEIKAIKAGRLIDGTGRAPVENAMVIIENAKIKTVGQNIKIPKEAQVIDATGKTVMPGMIDAHMHLNGPRLEESYVEGLNRPGELKLLDAITDAMDYLSAGFTTAKACGGMNGVFIKRAIAEGTLTGLPRILSTSYMLINTRGNPYPYLPAEYVDARTSKHLGSLGKQCLICDGVDECIKATRYSLSQGADFVKIWARGGACHNPEELKAIVQTAAEANKHVTIHTENSISAEMAILAGVKTIDHATGVEDKVVEMGNKAGTIFISTLICPKAIIELGDKLGRPLQETAWAQPVFDLSVLSYKRIRQLGGAMAMGTDYGAEILVKKYGSSAIELELLVNYCDFTPMEAIVTATRNGARAVYMEDMTGTVEPGKSADIIIIDGDPLADIKVLQDVGKIKMVMLEGNIEIER